MKKLIVANWKCNPQTKKKAVSLIKKIHNELFSFNLKKTEVVLCPPFLFIETIFSFLEKLEKKEKKKILLGAQNSFWEKEGGAFCGEISPMMLKNFSVKYVIVGHSERRKYLKEDDQMIAKKIKALFETKISPILCVGETEKERKEERTAFVIKTQLKKSLSFLKKYSKKFPLEKINVAYEPVWAIGTGNFCPPKEALKMLIYIKKILFTIFGRKKGEKIRILYGGSVSQKNAKAYIKEGFQGLLIGGVSLKPKEFCQIIKEIENL